MCTGCKKWAATRGICIGYEILNTRCHNGAIKFKFISHRVPSVACVRACVCLCVHGVYAVWHFQMEKAHTSFLLRERIFYGGISSSLCRQRYVVCVTVTHTHIVLSHCNIIILKYICVSLNVSSFTFFSPSCYFFAWCILIHRNVIHVLCSVCSFRIHNWNAWPKMRTHTLLLYSMLAGVYFAIKQTSYCRLMSLSTVVGWWYFWHCKIENKNERCRCVCDAYVSRIIVVIFISITTFFSLHFVGKTLLLLLHHLHLFVFNNLFLFYMEIKMVQCTRAYKIRQCWVWSPLVFGNLLPSGMKNVFEYDKEMHTHTTQIHTWKASTLCLWACTLLQCYSFGVLFFIMGTAMRATCFAVFVVAGVAIGLMSFYFVEPFLSVMPEYRIGCVWTTCNESASLFLFFLLFRALLFCALVLSFCFLYIVIRFNFHGNVYKFPSPFFYEK